MSCFGNAGLGEDRFQLLGLRRIGTMVSGSYRRVGFDAGVLHVLRPVSGLEEYPVAVLHVLSPLISRILPVP